MHADRREEYRTLKTEQAALENRITKLREGISQDPWNYEHTARQLLGYASHLRRLQRWVWELERQDPNLQHIAM